MHARFAFLMALLSIAGGAVNAQSLEVANSPSQPQEVWHRTGSGAQHVVACFRLTSVGVPSSVISLTFTNSGTGSWTNDVGSIQVYLDNGDAAFGAASDPLLSQLVGAPTATATLGPGLALATDEAVDLWVVVGFLATAGMGHIALPETFDLRIASAADVAASIPVVLGLPAPVGVTLGAIEFEVTSFVPLSSPSGGGQAITIDGKGFAAPFEIRIGGISANGTAVITGGLQVTGLVTPPGAGTALPIVVRSGKLPPQTLNDTFSYGGNPPPPPPPPAGTRMTVATSQYTFASGSLAWLGDVPLAGKAATFTIQNNDPATDLVLTGTPSVQIGSTSNCDATTMVQSQPGQTVIPPLETADFSVFVDPETSGTQVSLLVEIPNNYLAMPFLLVIGGNAEDSSGAPDEGNGSDADSGCVANSRSPWGIAVVLLAFGAMRRRQRGRALPR